MAGPPIPKQPIAPTATVNDRGSRIALIFGLVAERLAAYYEYGQWLSEAQGASLASEWLARTKRSLPHVERRQLSGLSDSVARQIAGSVSREAGLYISHELSEALDPNYLSDIAESIMLECERVLDAAQANA